MRFVEKCAILAGGVDDSGTVVVTVMNDALAEKRVQHSIPLVREAKGWVGLETDKVVPFLTAGFAPIGADPGSFVLVGWAGQVLRIHGRQADREAIIRDGASPSIIRGVRAISGVPYTAGRRRQVYRRAADGTWSPVETGLYPETGDDFYGFEDIDGFESGELYAVGDSGDLWLSRSDRWERIDCPTNVHLHSVHCAPHGAVYAGGRMGVLLEGHGHNWRVVDTGIEDTIWALCWFAGHLYVFSEDGVHRWSGVMLEEVGSDLLAGGGFYKVGRNREQMWCFARKRIVIFDGETWQSEPCELADPVDADLVGFFNDDVLRGGSVFLPDD